MDSNLQTASILANKLYRQCKYIYTCSEVCHVANASIGQYSPSSYKLLASSVWSLRNGLERAEQIFDENRTLGPDDLRFLTQVARSRDILGRLDLALQSYRCSTNKDVDESAVADFKDILDVTTHKLTAAFEVVTTGEIPFKLDTTNIPLPFPPAKSAASSAVDSNHGPRSSQASDAWSLVARDSPSLASASTEGSSAEGKNVFQPSEQKEVFAFDSAFPEGVTPQERTVSLDWRSPFASPDPLSISIEQATNIILREDDDLFMSASARPRSSTGGSSMFVGAKLGQEVLSNSTPSVAKAEVRDSMESAREQQSKGMAEEEEEVKPADLSVTIPSHEHGLGTTRLEPPTFLTTSISEPADGGASRRGSDAGSDVTHLTPKSATKELASRSRSGSAASLTIPGATPSDTDKSSDDDEDPNRTSPGPSENEAERPAAPAADESTNEGGTINLATSVVDENLSRSTAEESATGSKSLVEELSAFITKALDGDDSDKHIATKPVPPPPAFDDELSSVQEDGPLAPLMPSRRPPPPPKPRRSRTQSTPSRYKIANETREIPPVDEPSSDDELYSTSKPASPSISTQPVHLRTASKDIPEVNIDASALEEGADDPDKMEHAHHTSEDTSVTNSEEPVLLPRTTYTPLGSAKTASAGAGEREKNTSASGSTNDQQSAGNMITSETEPPNLASRQRSVSDIGPKSSRESLGQTEPPKRKASTKLRPISVLGFAPKASQDKSDEAAVPEGRPPPVPTRPIRYRNGKRPFPAFTQTSPAVVPHDDGEKELVPESGLEVSHRLNVSSRFALKSRISVDHALNISSPTASRQSTDGGRHSRAASASQLDPSQASATRSGPAKAGIGLRDWYAPDTDQTTTTELDDERINHIVHFWNSCAWDQAEAYLMGYLESLVVQDNLACARRVRHLLGCCISLKGQWSRAIPHFISVMNTPISESSQIDDGDCSAAYWLGDAYAMLNQRTEALLAYCIAERSSLFHDPSEPSLADCINAEQTAVQLGASKSDFKVRFATEAWRADQDKSAGGSILSTKVITTNAAKVLLENEPRRARRTAPFDSPFVLATGKSRANALFGLNRIPAVARYHRTKIGHNHFQPGAAWPMMYDPTFAMANVQRGRLLAYECDLLSVFKSNAEAKIPKSGPMGLSRMDCFTGNDLTWLITTIRECLKVLEMEWNEVANVEGTWFVVRYSFMQHKVATTHYFSIALFRQSFRSGYGVEICPDGICSARIVKWDIEHEKGVHNSEPRRIRKLIREYLDEAGKGRPKTKKKDSVGGPPSAASPTVADDGRAAEGMPPPIPPRPKKVA